MPIKRSVLRILLYSLTETYRPVGSTSSLEEISLFLRAHYPDLENVVDVRKPFNCNLSAIITAASVVVIQSTRLTSSFKLFS